MHYISAEIYTVCVTTHSGRKISSDIFSTCVNQQIVVFTTLIPVTIVTVTVLVTVPVTMVTVLNTHPSTPIPHVASAPP